jgi:archaellum biogenesis ATPase FlaH
LRFESSGALTDDELLERSKIMGRLMYTGVQYLDDCMFGILPDDLVLIGAPTGVGKTQLCVNIAKHNIMAGKRVHYIALEASRFEIERRLKFPMVMEKYHNDPFKKDLPPISYVEWYAGKYLGELANYEVEVSKEFSKTYKNLHVLYKKGKFGVDELNEHVGLIANETDLIVIDHVHYFDFEDSNENRAIKEVMIKARDLALEMNHPIILVAHLRKKQSSADDYMVAPLEEFHGSSDLTKIATRVITVNKGTLVAPGLYETYFRVSKNRHASDTNFMGMEFFDPKTRSYRHGLYEVGWCSQKRGKPFVSLTEGDYPDWGRRKRGS